MSNLGQKEKIFQKKLTGLQNVNAHQITAKVVIIPDGTFNTSNVTGN